MSHIRVNDEKALQQKQTNLEKLEQLKSIRTAKYQLKNNLRLLDLGKVSLFNLL
jgi:hypothetical protein